MRADLQNKDKLPLSVVIATLGSGRLVESINGLLSGDVIPSEILICIPKGRPHQLENTEFEELRIIEVTCVGQVAQRVCGLKNSKYPYVMQLDDDVVIRGNALGDLYQSIIKVGPKFALSPVFQDYYSQEYLTTYRSGLSGFFRSLFATAIGGAAWGSGRMGQIDPSGVAYAIDNSNVNRVDFFDVSWLPGGCVICRKEDLIIDNYFPFKGKAYFEDVIHSVIWRRRGVRLAVAVNISVLTEVNYTSPRLRDFIAEYRARTYVVSLTNGNQLRCRLRFIITTIYRLLFGCSRR